MHIDVKWFVRLVIIIHNNEHDIYFVPLSLWLMQYISDKILTFLNFFYPDCEVNEAENQHGSKLDIKYPYCK